jgi:uncharacterized protein YegL
MTLLVKNKTYLLLLILFNISLFFQNTCKAETPNDTHSILFLIDISGSMKGAKIDSVKSATKRIISMLLPCNTEFAVMGYSGKIDNPVPYQLPFTTNKNELYSFIDSMQPNSNTPLGAGLKTASYYIKNYKNPKSIKQTIILLGDGRSDDNVTEALKELTERNAIIQCECIGFCIQYDKQAEQQLKQIALETKGEYYSATEATNVSKAFFKTSIKTIIGDIPVVVRNVNKSLNFKVNSNTNFYSMMNQNWIVDSIQVNALPDLYEIAYMITDENMQDTLPKSIVFDTKNKISLFINNGTKTDVNKKWTEGKYLIDKNSLIIHLSEHYLKLIVKKLEKQSMVLCVNKYKSLTDSMVEGGEICDCENTLTEGKATILIYLSQPGCN